MNRTIFLKIKAFAILTIIVLWTSCNDNKPEEHINISPYNEMTASELVDSVEYLMLEKTNNCVLSEIDAVKVCEDMICIQSERQLFFFDKKGSYVGKINHLGSGHGEYLNINDFVLYKNKVYILSSTQNTLFVYSVDDNFICKYDLGDQYQHFSIVDENTIVLSSEQCNDRMYNFVYFDLKDNKILSSVDEFQKNESFLISGFNAFVNRGQKLLVSHPFDYSLYSLESDCIIKKYSFSFDTEDQLPPNENSLIELNEKTKNKKTVRYLQEYAEIGTNKYLIYPLFGDSGIKTCITKIKKNRENQTLRIGQDIDEKYPYFCIGRYYGIFDDKIIMSVDASSLLEIEHEYNLTSFTKKNLTEDCNPVLFFYKLKDK